MPRTPITSTYNTRTSITSSYNTRTKLDYILTEALGRLLTEDGGGLLLERSLNSTWSNRTKPTSTWS